MPPGGQEWAPQRKAGEILSTKQFFLVWGGVWCLCGGSGGEKVPLK